MYLLKLVKGLSCRVGKVRATKDKPFCEVYDEQSALQAVKSEYFIIIKSSTEATQADDDDGEEPVIDTPIDEMTIAECKAFAKEHDIDIRGLTKVDDLRTRILEATQADDKNGEDSDDFEPDFEDEDESHTMVKLQE